MNAYNHMYLSDAQSNMGAMLDHAVYDLKWDLDEFYRAFINSGIARRFGDGDPRYIAGMSGIELAQEIVRIIRGEMVDVIPSCPFDRSPEYWAGWAVAYYQWNSGSTFERVEAVVPITEIADMYQPFHEADISKFVDELDRRISDRTRKTALARLRAYAGLTQKALAERAGVSVRMIQQYEQGQKSLAHARADVAVRLSRALFCNVEDIL